MAQTAGSIPVFPSIISALSLPPRYAMPSQLFRTISDPFTNSAVLDEEFT